MRETNANDINVASTGQNGVRVRRPAGWYKVKLAEHRDIIVDR